VSMMSSLAFVNSLSSGQLVSSGSKGFHSTSVHQRRAPSPIVCHAGQQSPQDGSRIKKAILSSAIAAALAFSPAVVGVDQMQVQAIRNTVNGGSTFQSSSGRVNKDAESLLRWALPVQEKYIREIQANLEEITYDIRAFRWNAIENDVKKTIKVLDKKSDEIIKAVAEGKRDNANQVLESMRGRLDELKVLVAARSSDEVISLQRDILREVGRLEQMMIGKFPYEIPEEYKELPKLLGRAVVEMNFKKADGGKFDIEGELFKTAKMTMVVDGYNAPISAGNFVDLVKRGFYNKLEITRSDGFVVQTGDPAGDADGFIDPRTEKIRKIPLEIFARGDKTPTYGITLEDDGRASANTVLPFTSYGTMAMAREEFSADTGSSQFFWFLFEPDLTPAGRNLLDGRYSVFGYVVEGGFFLRDIKQGDVIVDAKVVAGLENFDGPKDVVQYKGAELERG